MKIETAHGRVTVSEAGPERYRALAQYLPLVGPLPSARHGARYGLVMKQGSRETLAVKQQTVDWPAEAVDEVRDRHQSLVALALKRYLAVGFPGVLVPAVYVCRKRKRRVEVGVAYFGAAEPVAGRVAGPAGRLPRSPAFGESFSQMVASFVDCMGRAAKRSNLALPPIIDLDYHPRSALGAVDLRFATHGRDLYALEHAPDDRDPVWALLRSTGIRRAWALPAMPVEIPAGSRVPCSERPPAGGSLRH